MQQMSAEFRVVRERLGLSIDQVAEMLNVQTRAVLRWDDGAELPEGIDDWLWSIEAQTAELVRTQVDKLRGADAPRLLTFESDESFRKAFPGSPLSAEWHRAWTGRVAAQVPGATVSYAE